MWHSLCLSSTCQPVWAFRWLQTAWTKRESCWASAHFRQVSKRKDPGIFSTRMTTGRTRLLSVPTSIGGQPSALNAGGQSRSLTMAEAVMGGLLLLFLTAYLFPKTESGILQVHDLSTFNYFALSCVLLCITCMCEGYFISGLWSFHTSYGPVSLLHNFT